MIIAVKSTSRVLRTYEPVRKENSLVGDATISKELIFESVGMFRYAARQLASRRRPYLVLLHPNITSFSSDKLKGADDCGPPRLRDERFVGTEIV